jgi:hypothetical protein
MNVNELINELKKYPPENQALIVSSESGSFIIVNVFGENNITYIEGE